MFIDNKKNGKVGNVLKQNITNNSKFSIILGYFTIYAFVELKKELIRIKELRFLFGASIFKNGHISNYLSGELEKIKFKNQLQQVKIAHKCASWIKDKVNMNTKLTKIKNRVNDLKEKL